MVGRGRVGRGKFCLVLHIYVFSVEALFSYPVLYYNERGTNTSHSASRVMYRQDEDIVHEYIGECN